MPDHFLEILSTPSVIKAQACYYDRPARMPAGTRPDSLTAEEIQFIRARDSFYMATVSESGWPYVQHRGGKPGFLRVLSPAQIGFADFRGNRQLLSTGHLAANNRVALFLMDYPHRDRLKILGHARVEDARAHPELARELAEPETRGLVERVFLIRVVSFDWNCSQHITPRHTDAEVEEVVAPMRRRIAELEAQLRAGGGHR